MHTRPSDLMVATSTTASQTVMNSWEGYLLSKKSRAMYVSLAVSTTFFEMTQHSRLWSDTLIIPSYMVAGSALALLLHIILISPPIKRLYARFFQNTVQLPPADSSSSAESEILAPSFSDEVKEHITKHGGVVIFAYQVARLFGCVVLLGLSIASTITSEHNEIGLLSKWGKKHKKHRKSTLAAHEWLELAMCMTYVCTLFIRRILDTYPAL